MLSWTLTTKNNEDWVLYSFHCMLDTPPSLNISKGSALGLICTQTKLFITKGIVFSVYFAIH